jgi:hypothetical protein
MSASNGSAGQQRSLQAGNEVNAAGNGSLQANSWLLQVYYEVLQ